MGNKILKTQRIKGRNVEEMHTNSLKGKID
jgi:hypothetical protein